MNEPGDSFGIVHRAADTVQSTGADLGATGKLRFRDTGWWVPISWETRVSRSGTSWGTAVEEVVYGKRSPYALTNGGVVWQHLGSATEPKVLRFPVVKVGSREESLWCALGDFVHQRRGGGGEKLPPLEPQSLLSRVKDRSLLRASVALAEIDLLEQEGSLRGWVQPLMEVPPSVPLVVEGEAGDTRDRWVWEILGRAVPQEAWPVGVSYSLCGPRRDSGDHGFWLLLAAGDLSGHRGWRCLKHPAPQFPAGPPPVLPGPPPSLPGPPASPLSITSASSTLPPSMVPPLHSPPSHLFRPEDVNDEQCAESSGEELAEVDLVQMSVDTLQMPTLRRQVVDRMRRARLARSEVR